MAGKLAPSFGFLCILAMSAPARPAPVPSALETLESEIDDMLGITWYRDPSEFDAVGFYFGMKRGQLLPLRIKIQYRGSDWLFTRSLLFKVDGKLFPLLPPWNAWERDNSGSTIWETLDLPTPASSALVRALADAKSVKVRFIGKHIDDYELPDKEVAALRRVYWIWRATRSPSDKRARDRARVLVRSYLEEKRARDAEKRAQEPRAIV